MENPSPSVPYPDPLPGEQDDAAPAEAAPLPYPDPLVQENVASVNAPTPAQIARYSYANMIKEVRSWGFWMLGLAVVQLFMAQSLYSPWALLQLIVGLASFYFRTSAMFMVYAIILSWAAFSNAFSGSSGWITFSVIQVFMTFQVLRDFNRYRQAEAAYRSQPHQLDEPAPAPDFYDRGSKVFPISGCLIGGLAAAGVMVGLVLIFAGVMIGAESGEMPPWVETALLLLVGLVQIGGVIGLGVNLGSLLVKYPERVFSWLGLAASAIAVIVSAILIFAG